jgi:type I restriction enzyme S subunit
MADISQVANVNPTLDKSAIPDNLPVSFIPMPAVEAGNGRIDLHETRPFSEVKKGYTPFLQGDVLFAKITPCMENGKMAIVPALTNGLGFGSTEFHVLRPFAGMSAAYFYHFVSSQVFRREAEHNMTGAVGQRRVPTKYLSGCPIPVPPAAEQLRIVAKLEELFSALDKAVESLTTAREQLKVYRQAVLKHAFEGKLTAVWRCEHPDWRQTRVGDEIEFLTSGSRGWADYYSDQGEIFIRAQNLKHDRLDLTDIAFVKLPSGSAEGIRTRVQVGDVLITITGANVTKTGILQADIGTAYVSQHVALCRSGPTIVPEFLYWYLLSEAGGRRQLNMAAYGAGKPGLNLDNIRDVTISLPHLDEQQYIVALINAAISDEGNLSATIDAELSRTTALRHSILKKAFSGQLAAQDQTDEPAAALLERIRAEREQGGRTRQKTRKCHTEEAA